MKIAIIGATGRVGGLVADELINRGHEITGFVIDPQNIRNDKIKVVEKSIFEITKADLEPFKVVISAFGQFTPGLGNQHQIGMMMLIHALCELPETRLLVVGGAASLFTDAEMQHRALELIPEKFHEVPANMFEAFKLLQNSKVNWTYFSPAFTFDPAGERTGSYVLGTDFIFNNEDGESYISYADYAIAMADEAENGQFIGRRFTAVGRRKKEETNEKAVPEVKEEVSSEQTGKVFADAVFEGNSKYRSAPVTELQGKAFDLVLDNGEEGTLIFNSETTVTWAPLGEAPRTDRYDCLKIDDDTYFVSIEWYNYHPRTGIVVVLDLEQELVTWLYQRQEVDKRTPDKVVNDFVFGAIRKAGRELPKFRHGFTSDLVGTRISWRYNDAFSISHCYYDANYIRTPLPPEDDHSERAELFRQYPYDVPCRYVRIKKDIYLISFIEDFTVSRGRVGSCLTILMDIAKLHDVGRSWGTWAGKWENYLFSAIGKWENTTEWDTNPDSKYRA